MANSIIGRDMAGSTSSVTGDDFYGAYDAQDLAKAYSEELGVKTVPSLNIVYTEEKGYVTADIASDKDLSIKKLSGTKFRQMLRAGEDIPEWFAFQSAGIVPDAITVAKGIGGGFPIGALIAFGAAADLLQPGDHGTTFGGNPLATATANAVLGEIERAGLVDNARTRGAQLRLAILEMASDLVTDVQGSGLLIGVGLARPVAQRVAARALELGLIVNAAAPDRIRLAPPLIIDGEHVARFALIFATALTDIAAELAGEDADPSGETP